MIIHWERLLDFVRGVNDTMGEGNRRIVSSDRVDLIEAYERETTHRGRAVASNNLWMSLPAKSRQQIALAKGHHPGLWLQDQLAASDERLGLPALTPNSRNSLRVLLLQEEGTKGRPGRDVSKVWQWLDDGEISPQQLKLMLSRVDDLMQAPGASWDGCLERAKELAKAGRKAGRMMREWTAPLEPAKPEPEPLSEPPKPVEEPAKPEPPPEPPEAEPPPKSRGTVEKTLQYQAFRKILDEAPDPRSLPVPPGVDASTYRDAYVEMLENVRVALELASRDFHNAKRRYRSTEISFKAGAIAKACRTLRVAVPPSGQPVDEFNSRRKWLEIVKAYHPDKNAGDESKVEIYDAANKAFATIKEYNRKLADQKSRRSKEKTNVDDEQQGAAQS